MTKPFYVQLDSQNRITDVISMPHEGYQLVELEVPLPPNILSGAYELLEGSPVYRIRWDTKEQERQERMDKLEGKIREQESLVSAILGVGEE